MKLAAEKVENTNFFSDFFEKTENFSGKHDLAPRKSGVNSNNFAPKKNKFLALDEEDLIL